MSANGHNLSFFFELEHLHNLTGLEKALLKNVIRGLQSPYFKRVSRLGYAFCFPFLLLIREHSSTELLSATS